MSAEITTAEQPSLFSEIELDLLTIDLPETRKRYTAASLERCVAKRDAIVRAMAEGHGLLRIAKAFGVSHHLVSSLRDSRPDLVAIEKKQLSGQIGRILKMSADRFEEGLVEGKISPAQIPVAFGIFSDKKAALDGDASMIVEHRHKIEASASGFLSRLKAAVDSKSTETESIPQQKGVVVDAELVSDTSRLLPVATSGSPRISSAETRTAGGGDAPGGGVGRDTMDSSTGGKTQKESL